MPGSGDSVRAATGGPGGAKGVALRIVRWVAFIPAGFLLVSVIQYFSSLAAVWLVGNLALMIVLAVLALGGLLFLLWIVVLAQFTAVYLACGVICPSPRIGSVIWGTLYYINSVPVVMRIFVVGGGPRVVVPLFLMRVIFLVTAGAAVYYSYKNAGLPGSDAQTQGVEQKGRSGYVYITSGGKRFHREGCRMLGGGGRPVPIQDAESRGCEPCKVCSGDPDRGNA